MSELTPRESSNQDVGRPLDYCTYCSAELNPLFYFCTRCATPYKASETVIPPERPPHMGTGERIRARAPQAWPVFWTYFIVVLGSGVLGSLLFQEDRPDLMILLGTGAIFVTTCVVGTIYWRTLAAQFRKPGLTTLQGWGFVALVIPALGLNYVYFLFLTEVLSFPSGNMFDELRAGGMTATTLVLLFCVLPAITEEIAFRGLIQQWLRAAVPPMRALTLTAALFAAMHFSIVSFPYLFLLGLLMGWAKLRTGSLYPPILIHFLHNFVVIEYF